MPFSNEGDFPFSLEFIFTFRLTNINPCLNSFYSKNTLQVLLRKLLFQIPKLLLEKDPKELGSQA